MTEKKSKSSGIQLIAQSLKWALLLFLSTFGVVILFGLILGFLETKSQTYLYGAFGWAGIVVTGIIGTPIHEMAHFLMCLPFGIKVYEVSLFRPFAGRQDGILGYVTYSREPGNLVQTIGTLFVGIAPMILGPLVLIILFRLLVPECYKQVKDDIGKSLSDDNITIKSVLKSSAITVKSLIVHLFHFTKKTAARNIVMLYFLLAISSHTTLSVADIVNALPGFIVIMTVYIILGFIAAASKQDIGKDILKSALTIAAFFMIALVFSIFATLISMGFFSIFGRFRI